jgi:hypothetical protein
MEVLDSFRAINTDRNNTDELVALTAFGKTLRAEYDAHKLTVPGWVDDNLEVLRREIASRRTDELKKQLRDKKARLEALTPTEERRDQLRKDIEALEKDLA